MANTNAVIIRKPKLYKIPTTLNLAHNSGINRATYWLNDGKNIIQNIKFDNKEEIDNIWEKWQEEAKARYKNNPLSKRVLKSNAVIVEEGLIVIGSHVQVTQENIINILNDFVKKFEVDNNTKILHWAYHNHEGHEENRKEVINRHAHFLFANVNNNGVMVRRNWKRDYLKKLQDDIFEISKNYIPNIERGKEATYTEVYIDGNLIKINERKHEHHRVFREKQKQESIRNQLIKEKVLEDKKLNSQINLLQKQNDDLVLKNRLFEIKINELNSLVFSEKKYKDSDNFVSYKELINAYIRKDAENVKKMVEQNTIIDKLRFFAKHFKPYREENPNLLSFIDYIQKGFDEIKEIYAKNKELNNEIIQMKNEIERLEDLCYSKQTENDDEEIEELEEIIYDPTWDDGSLMTIDLNNKK